MSIEKIEKVFCVCDNCGDKKEYPNNWECIDILVHDKDDKLYRSIHLHGELRVVCPQKGE